MSFQALIFDLGGVVIPHDNAYLARRIASRCPDPGLIDEIERIGMDDRYMTGELSVRDLHERLAREVGYASPWEVFAVDWCSHLDVDRAMMGFVERLALTNRVMLFSNINQEHWDHVRDATGGVLGRFEAYLSHELGAVKPHVEAFQLVAERAGVDPSRCLFIDDRPENVAGARRAGFKAEQFTGEDVLAALLREAGVDWPDHAEMETV